MLHLLKLFHFLHQFQRLLIAERTRSVKQIVETALEVLKRVNIVKLLHELVKRGLRGFVLERIVRQLLHFLAQALRQLLEKLLLLFEFGLLRPLLLQRALLLIQNGVQTLLHLVERGAHIGLAVAFAHLFAQVAHEIVQALELIVLIPQALAHEMLKRLLHIIRRGQMFGQLFEDFVGRQPDTLAAIPVGITNGDHVSPEARSRNAGIIEQPARLYYTRSPAGRGKGVWAAARLVRSQNGSYLNVRPLPRQARVRFPDICLQNRLNNVSMNFHCSEQGILRVAVLSGNRRNKLGNRLATFRNGHCLSGLYDLVENGQTFCLEL